MTDQELYGMQPLKTPQAAIFPDAEVPAFFSKDAQRPDLDPQAIQRELFRSELEKEIKYYSNFLSRINLLDIKDTGTFWKQYRTNFEKLYSFALILLGIPSSSASIERFFSLCGFMSKKQGLFLNTIKV